jgi:hypothetical protein
MQVELIRLQPQEVAIAARQQDVAAAERSAQPGHANLDRFPRRRRR